MKYCTHCGKELLDDAMICTGCGCAVNGARQIDRAVTRDTPSAGLDIVAFLVPLAGLIMFCTMRAHTPRRAKQIGLFALIGFIIAFVLYYILLMTI